MHRCMCNAVSGSYATKSALLRVSLLPTNTASEAWLWFSFLLGIRFNRAEHGSAARQQGTSAGADVRAESYRPDAADMVDDR